MLHLIFGRSGSGKTYTIRDRLCQLADKNSDRLFLIVPEQYSFESERAMLHLLGAQSSKNVQVMSFTRLADAAFRTYGGIAGKRLEEGGRNVLMSLALEQVSESLPLYGRHAQTPELIQMMLGEDKEMKMCSISAQDLSRTAEQMEDGTLREKLKELGLVLSAYEALVAQSYLDPLDDLTRLCDVLKTHRYFEGATVMVDSFKGFTVQEFHVIEEILVQAKDVYVSLCSDSLWDQEQGMGLFSLVSKTASQMIRLAKKNNVAVAVPEYLEDTPRFCNTDLQKLEENIFRSAKIRQESVPENIVVFSAQNVYEEASFTAATIRKLVTEQGFRYSDFAVILRNVENYLGNLDVALERWEVPYFMDRPRSIESEPLMRLVLQAFRVVRSGFSSDDVFLYLKTGLAGLDSEEISLVENYTYLWQISGSKWKEEWKENPAGFSEEFTQEQTDQLQKINELRKRVVYPLLRFAQTLQDVDGEGMVQGVYQLLVEVDVPAAVRAFSKKLKEYGRMDLADQQLRLWDMLMEVLDQMALVLHGRRMSATRFSELLRLVIQAGNISTIPQSLDEVAVGSADRMRPADPKVVFLLGAVQGEFPLTPGTSGVFSDDERKRLIGLGLPLSSTMEEMAVEERFLAYAAMTSPSDRLYICLLYTSGLTRNQVARKGSWVRIPPLPPNLSGEIRGLFTRAAVWFLGSRVTGGFPRYNKKPVEP